MTAWHEYPCGNCGKELPPTGNKRRRVPRRGGRLLLVCDPCAQAIDRQVTLAGPDGGVLGSRSGR